jgi:hypothetical protein
MEAKKYSSYAEIDRDLKILKVEREINYQKIILNVDKTKESVMPSKAVSFVSQVIEKSTTGPIGTLLKIAVPYAVNWYVNRKRGN